MMPAKLYVAPALLLVLFSLCHGVFSVPVTAKGPMTDSCVFYARALLENITDALTQDDRHHHKKNLFIGIDCTKQNVELKTNSDTVSVCAPQETFCSGINKSQFNQELCLHNIGEDLRYYYKFLVGHPDPDRFLNNTVLVGLRELMKTCFSWSLPEDLMETSADRSSSYDERLSLCKELKGFQVRTITINRAIGYMSSGEHSK